jgi:hypothetical protein
VCEELSAVAEKLTVGLLLLGILSLEALLLKSHPIHQTHRLLLCLL